VLTIAHDGFTNIQNPPGKRMVFSAIRAVSRNSFCALVTTNAQKELRESRPRSDFFAWFLGGFLKVRDFVVRDRDAKRAKAGRWWAHRAPAGCPPREREQQVREGVEHVH